MLEPERLQQQSPRHSDPVESSVTSVSDCPDNEGSVGIFVKWTSEPSSPQEFLTRFPGEAGPVAFAAPRSNIGVPV